MRSWTPEYDLAAEEGAARKLAQKNGPRKRTPRATRAKRTTSDDTPPSPPSPAQQPQPLLAKPTLEHFISQNDKLLAAMAVLTGLAAFTKDLQVVGGYLSFVFIALTILVWFELLSKFWFENLLSIGILGLAAYWIVGVLLFARDTRSGVALPLTAVFLIPTLWATVKVTDMLWSRQTARSQPSTADRYATYIAVVLFAGLIANLAANFAAGPVTSALNTLQRPTTSPTPSRSPSPSPSPSPRPTPTPSPSASAAPT
jgi:hypothetical protein